MNELVLLTAAVKWIAMLLITTTFIVVVMVGCALMLWMSVKVAAEELNHIKKGG